MGSDQTRAFGMPDSEALVFSMLGEIRDDVRAIEREMNERFRDIDNTLRGKDGRNGLVGRVGANERWLERVQTLAEQNDARHRLKYLGKEDQPTGERVKAWIIWGGVAAGCLSFVANLFQYLTGN
jgi:hypothetical protein